MRLYEREPAARFDDAHLLGNGRLGASVYGGVPFEEVLINDDTLWSGSESYRVNDEFYDRLMEARKLTLNGNVKAANDLINDHMDGTWSQAYMPLASALICAGQRDARRHMRARHVFHPRLGEVADYSRVLDLDTAVETVSYVRNGVSYRREYFVSHDRQLIYAKLTAVGGALDFSLCLDSPLKHGVTVQDGEVTLRGIAPDYAEPDYNPVRPGLIYYDEADSGALRFAARARIVDTDGAVWNDRDRVYVNDASFAVIAIAAGTNYAGYEVPRDRDVEKVVERVTAQLDGAGDWETALAEHIADYKALYDRFAIDLGEEISGAQPSSVRFRMNAEGVFDPSVGALAVQYARYLLIAGSRPGTQAENLQGIWNDRVRPPWSSNYTTNINVEMNYWPAEPFALPECHEPMSDLVRECAESGKKVARDYYHLDGWVAHHNVDLWRMCVPACEDASWFFWPFGGAWMCQHLWTRYEYNRDEEFLRDVAYPVIREAARFHDRTLCTRLLASVTGGFTANMLIKDYIQIDSIFGYAAGIGEMLLQCHNGYIELLPTPAFGWTNGAFRGMRARGGFECDLKWQDDKPSAGRITAHTGGPCAVKALGLKGVHRPDGNVITPDVDGIARFDAERGVSYDLVF